MKRTQKTLYIVIVCFCLIVLMACNKQRVIQNNTSLASASPVSIVTLQALSTPLTAFEYPSQVTDGNVLFSATSEDLGCHNVNSPFRIKLIFTNLTDKSIRLPNPFVIAANRHGEGGNVSPFITSKDGSDVYSLADTQFVDVFATPSNSYYELPPKQTVNFTIDYFFPSLVAQIETDEIKSYITPTPAQYYIRFVYSEPQRDMDTWYGAIGSNRIEICILN